MRDIDEYGATTRLLKQQIGKHTTVLLFHAYFQQANPADALYSYRQTHAFDQSGSCGSPWELTSDGFNESHPANYP